MQGRVGHNFVVFCNILGGSTYSLNIKKQGVLIKGEGGVRNVLQTYQKRERGFNKSIGWDG